MTKFFILFFAFSAAASAADYKHCVKFANSYHSGTSDLFKLDSKGRVDISEMYEDVLHIEYEGTHIFKRKGGNSTNVITTVKTKDGRPTEVVEEFEKDRKKDFAGRTIYSMKNDVCYPEKREGRGINPFNANFCRELIDFISNNPDARTCKCGTEATEKKLNEIFQRYDDPSVYSSNYSNIGDDQSWKVITQMLSRPVNKAYEHIASCANIEGFADALGDTRLWGIKSSRPADVPGPRKGSSVQ